MNTQHSRSIALLTLSVLVLSLVSPLTAGERLKVFILAGQSNAAGHARGHTIATLYKAGKPEDARLAKLVFSNGGVSKALDEQLLRAREIDELTGGIAMDKLKQMSPGAEKSALETKVNELLAAHKAYKQGVIKACTTSDRVYIASIADRNKKNGKLGVGYGADNEKIGPEYGFGLSIAQQVEGPILLIKASWGGKSLAYDFRPPSSPDFKTTKSSNQDNAGFFWREMVKHVNQVLADPKTHHPDYDAAKGYEIAGFIWFQGFNDQFKPEFRGTYTQNMKTFIRDVRTTFKTPDMPFVIGVLGTGMTKDKVDANEVSQAQRAAALAPEFKGTVCSVESYTEYSHFSYKVFQKGWPKHYHEWDTVGSDRPYHYLGSGAFFVRLGDSFATSMAELMAAKEK
ncbi:MAG: hypothetical protein HN919_13190 [Verrucomicrobia bacterium]|nr:hypothetical protein [Verrucomicrobiota bacterium]MBT7067256.1 hypothetical protein [Verrucomicrobiota bacterium]